MLTDTVIVTRHPALVEYLQEIGLTTGGESVLAHARPEDVRGRDVIGVLPIHLAAEANTVTEVPMHLDPGDRGKELDLPRVREVAGSPCTYSVHRLSGVRPTQ